MAATFSTQYQGVAATVSSVTINNVVTPASQPFLIVGISNDANSTNVSNVTFNGTALTKLIGGKASVGAVRNFWLDVWYMANPPSTTASVVVTYNSSTTNGTVQIITASGVSASSPIGANPTPSTGATAGGTGDVPITTTLPSSLVVNMMFQDPFWGPTSITPTGTNQTRRGTTATGTNAASGSVSTQTTTDAGVYNDSWTWGISSNTSAYVSALIEVVSNDISASSITDSSTVTESVSMMVPFSVDEQNSRNWIPGLKIWTP